MGREFVPVLEANDPGRTAHVEAGDLGREQHFGAEPPGLGGRPPGKVAAPDTGGEAKVVLDPRALARLASDRFSLNEDRAQAFGRPVDGGPQAGWPAPDHDDVVERQGWCRRETQRLRDFDRRGGL